MAHGLLQIARRLGPPSSWGAIAASDFFSVEVLTRAGLVRYFVLFVIDLETRRVQIANISPQPCFVRRHRYIIHDRDPLFTKNFASILRDAGVKAFAERFVGSIRRECLDHIIPLGEQHLRLVVQQFVEHYNRERHHQGLGNALIDPEPRLGNDNGSIQSTQRLGGLLNFYHRGAA